MVRTVGSVTWQAAEKPIALDSFLRVAPPIVARTMRPAVPGDLGSATPSRSWQEPQRSELVDWDASWHHGKGALPRKP